MNLEISSIVRELCPELKVAVLQCKVINSETSVELTNTLNAEILEIKTRYKMDEINKRPAIEATRAAYKKMGKDPNRYRPSAEALCRRIIREIPVYRINTLVDIINVVSIRSGYSIGGFDVSKIQGTKLTLNVGSATDTFEAIGRGELNVEGLPLYKDEIGGIGTPTSDHERTKITLETRELLIIINAYNGMAGLQEAIDHSIFLLNEFAFLESYDLNLY